MKNIWTITDAVGKTRDYSLESLREVLFPEREDLKEGDQSEM